MKNDPLPLAPAQRCPFLGVRADAATYSACDEQPNYCHRASPISPVKRERQIQVCCGAEHDACPIFAGQKPAHNFPQAWINRSVRRLPPLRLCLLVGVALGVLFVALMGFIFRHDLAAVVYGSPASRLASPTDSNLVVLAGSLTPSPTFFASNTSTLAPTLTPTPTFTLTSTSSPTPLAVPSPTASTVPSSTVRPPAPTPGPALETPFGAPRTFLVHRVKAGEYLTSIAARFQTSLAVLRAVNGLNPNGILATGTLLVIAPGQTSPGGLPALKPLFISTRIRVADLAQAHSMPEAELRQLNALGPGDWVEPGRYVVIRK